MTAAALQIFQSSHAARLRHHVRRLRIPRAYPRQNLHMSQTVKSWCVDACASVGSFERMKADREKPEFIVTVNGPTKRRVGGPIALNSRMLAMIRLMVHGDENSRVPFDPFEAGRIVGYRRAAVRHLATAPAFMKAYEAAKVGKPPALVPTLEEIAREEERRGKDRSARATKATAGYVIRLPASRDPGADA